MLMRRSTAAKSFDVSAHFSGVSASYRRLRTLDHEPLIEIASRLPACPISGFDAGCGTGRYTISLIRMLRDADPSRRLRFVFLDATPHMLRLAKRHARGISADLSFVDGKEGRLADFPDSFDFGMTTNAIHHMDLQGFLQSAAVALRSGALLFIYTRTQEQNRRIIWGEHFPEFADRETRLLAEGAVESSVSQVTGLELEEVKRFAFERQSRLRRLVEQAKGRHYSTFSLYSPEEFDAALRLFESSVRSAFPDPENIPHNDENVMYIIRKN